MALGFDIWQLVVTRYTTPKTPPTDNIGNKASEHNAKAMNVILCGLLESEFVQVMHYESTKYIWDKLKNIYERNDNVKKEKLQTLKRKIKSFKMKDE